MVLTIAAATIAVGGVRPDAGEPKINGILIDCSRLTERHDYYFRLVDFMAGWEMNTLLFHFTDDHGCAVELPGMEHLAAPNAFTAEEARALVRYAENRGITIIPEVETFGHTRYITDLPEYSHLRADSEVRGLKHNALDPLHPDTLPLVEKILAATAELFPSKYLHIGGDEVDIEDYCRTRGLEADVVWSDYVNRVALAVRRLGRKPMVWDDRIRGNPTATALLGKSLVPVSWHYRPTPPTGVDLYRTAGFRETILAPSVSCSKYRVKPSATGLENTVLLAKECRRLDLGGLITTVWVPSRYIQGAMYYGIAFSSHAFTRGGEIDRTEFHARFASTVFGADLDPELDDWLSRWSDLELPSGVFSRAANNTYWIVHSRHRVAAVNASAAELVRSSPRFKPKRNVEIWQSMVLSAEVMWAVSEAVLIKNNLVDQKRRETFPLKLKNLVTKVDRDWDRGRFPNDPAKTAARFDSWEDHYLLLTLTGMLADFP